jgi:hypothetical protein
MKARAKSPDLAQRLLDFGSLGTVYPSRERGRCVACFHPSLITNVRKAATYWRGPDPTLIECPVRIKWDKLLISHNNILKRLIDSSPIAHRIRCGFIKTVDQIRRRLLRTSRRLDATR